MWIRITTVLVTITKMEMAGKDNATDKARDAVTDSVMAVVMDKGKAETLWMPIMMEFVTTQTPPTAKTDGCVKEIPTVDEVQITNLYF